jgi:UDP-4-amino-4,6-dideoxy-N-acetyl-beta-L-altrosamine N-acetyltransferase
MVIELRGIRPEDKEMIRNWRNLAEVARYMYTDHYITAGEHEEWLEGVLKDPKRLYWIITNDQEDVGLAYIYNIDRQHKSCCWGFYIASPRLRGRGLGSFVEYSILRCVFEDLNFNRLCCEVIASNQSAIQIHKRFGFVQEGYFREHVIKGGQPMDVVSLAILRKEWELKRPEVESLLKRKGLL